MRRTYTTYMLGSIMRLLGDLTEVADVMRCGMARAGARPDEWVGKN